MISIRSRSIPDVYVRRVIRATALVVSAVVFAECSSVGGFTIPYVTIVTGVVTSSLGGPLANVEVDVTPTGYSTVAGTTSADGAYSLVTALVTTGVVWIPLVPAGCTTPAPKAYTADKNFTARVNVRVTCEAPAGAPLIAGLP